MIASKAADVQPKAEDGARTVKEEQAVARAGHGSSILVRVAGSDYYWVVIAALLALLAALLFKVY